MPEVNYKILCRYLAGFLMTNGLVGLRFKTRNQEFCTSSFPLNQKNPPKSRFR
jgi:hypothetical protein